MHTGDFLEKNGGMELIGQGIRFFQEVIEMAKILPKNEEG